MIGSTVLSMFDKMKRWPCYIDFRFLILHEKPQSSLTPHFVYVHEHEHSFIRGVHVCGKSEASLGCLPQLIATLFFKMESQVLLPPCLDPIFLGGF